MSQQPQGPGWWRAPDGRWYPPQPPGAYGPPPGPPPPQRSHRGCIIAVVVVAVLLLAAVGVGVYFFYRLANTVTDVATGGASQLTCPSDAQVSQIVGSPVTLTVSGSLYVAAGCSYLAADRERGVDVQITTGVSIIADEQYTSFQGDAATQDVAVTQIPVGERGQAYGGSRRSAAITVDGSRLIEVEVFSAGEPIGDKQAAAVALLQLVLVR